MKRGGLPHGYTVLEVLIVITVSSMLFVSAYALFSGRQANVEFTQATRDLELKIRNSLNEVTTGYFPDNVQFACTESAGKPNITPIGPNEQGTNKDCIFLGKMLQFGPQSGSSCTDAPSDFSDCEGVNIYTLVGVRQKNGNDVKTLTEAQPTALFNGSVDATERYQIPYGIHITNMFIPANAGPATALGATAFIGPLNGSGQASLASNGQQPRQIPVMNTTLGMTETNATSNLSTNLDESKANPEKGVMICLRAPDGSNRSGILIGGNGRSVTVESFFNETFDQKAQALGVTC